MYTIEQFKKEIFNLHPEGDLTKTYNAFINTNKMYNILTPSYLKNKYIEYLTAKKSKQNGVYTKSIDQIVNLETFINNKLWNQSFTKMIKKTIPERDSYLYGIDIIKNN